jgi:hypothetical protein
VYHSSSRSIAALALTSIAIISSGCGNGTATQVSSIAITGQPVISFPNRNDRLGTTILSSNAAAQQAGVDGQTLTITTQDLNRGTQHEKRHSKFRRRPDSSTRANEDRYVSLSQ